MNLIYFIANLNLQFDIIKGSIIIYITQFQMNMGNLFTHIVYKNLTNVSYAHKNLNAVCRVQQGRRQTWC